MGAQRKKKKAPRGALRFPTTTREQGGGGRAASCPTLISTIQHWVSFSRCWASVTTALSTLTYRVWKTEFVEQTASVLQQ